VNVDRVELVIAVLVELSLEVTSQWHILLGGEKMLMTVITILKTDTCIVDAGLGEPMDS